MDAIAVQTDDRGLVSKVPTEVFLAYENRARSIAEQYAPTAAGAAKLAILRAMCEARISGEAAGASSPSPSPPSIEAPEPRT
jgi:enoyl-CoA hydratase/carnithine racemase